MNCEYQGECPYTNNCFEDCFIKELLSDFHNLEKRYFELQKHHGEIVKAYSIQRNKAMLYKCFIEDLRKVLDCARNEDCDNCPKCGYCEELCDNKDNLMDVLNNFYEDYE